MIATKIFVLLGLLLAIHGTLAGMQKYSVKGRLLCGSQPASNVKVKLVDIDTGGPDDDMDQKATDGQGNFLLAGQTSEFTNIDPVLKLYHKCGQGILALKKRRWRFELPKKYIGKGSSSKPQTFDIGTLNLEMTPLAEDSNWEL